MADTVRSAPWSVEELNALSREDLVELFLSALPGPTAEEFQGEFDGFTPAYQERRMGDHYREAGLGRWLGKGYTQEPYGRWAGHGYNIWGTDDGTRRRTRFGWELGTSVIDGGPCLLMHYRAFDNVYADIDLVDEIRVVGEGLYLGLAMTPKTSPICPDRGPDGRALPTTFLLQGPVTGWIGADEPSGEQRGR